MIAGIRQNQFLRQMICRALVGRIATRQYPGDIGSLSFPADQHLNLFFRKLAILEKTATENLARLIRPGDLVFDIGANIGYYTVLFSRWVAHGGVVAVEPDPQNYAVLMKNLHRNDLKNVSPVRQAVSSEGGTATLFCDRATGRTSSLEEAAWHPDQSAIMRDDVPATTIDTLAEQFGAPALIKCDVEGHEVGALEGARKTLLSQPVLMVEVTSRNQRAVERILSGYGYVFYDADKPLAHSFSKTEISGFNVLALPGQRL